ncbi:MAG TPA: EamA family transporter, partial [Candidatus Korarchaeota archaeon]|nr:EamA family transporter [Candidatus Korarchaeota archaeon]
MRGSKRPDVDPRLVLILGVSAVSLASILIKLSAAPPLVIGANRLGIASLTLLLISAPTLKSIAAELRHQATVLTLSGVSLAVHFGTWITSLEYTSVAASVVLTDSAPIFSVLLAWIALGELPTRRESLGVALGVAGASIIGYGSLSLSHTEFKGALLALAGAV